MMTYMSTLFTAISIISALIWMPVAEATTPNAPGLTFLYSLNTTVGEQLEMSNGPWGTRVAVPVTGGTFEGPRLSGEVLNLGAEWGIHDAHGTFRADARYQLRTSDGANIYVQISGASQSQGPAQSRIILETGSEEYYWVNSVIAVGITTLGDGWVAVDAWQLVDPE